MINIITELPEVKSKFIDELKAMLIGYLAPSYHKFSVICNKQDALCIEELFSEHALLPLFIYDKNPYVSLFLNQFNAQFGTQFNAQFSLVYDTNAITDMRVHFEHNIPLKETSASDDLAYRAFHGLKCYLSHLIISSKVLTVKDNVLSVDQLIIEYTTSVNNKNNQVINPDTQTNNIEINYCNEWQEEECLKMFDLDTVTIDDLENLLKSSIEQYDKNKIKNSKKK